MKKLALLLAVIMAMMAFSVVFANDVLRSEQDLDEGEENVLLIAPNPDEIVDSEEMEITTTNKEDGIDGENMEITTTGEEDIDEIEYGEDTSMEEDVSSEGNEVTPSVISANDVETTETKKSGTITGAIIAIVIVVVVVALAALIQKK